MPVNRTPVDGSRRFSPSGPAARACHPVPVAWLVSEARVLAAAEIAADGAARRRGLRRREELDGAFVIPSCRWVHTMGMHFTIDVAFVDRDGVVIKIVRMRPWRLGAPVKHGRWVIEASTGAFERWGLSLGDVVELRQAE